jgi:hypothetical protein
MTFVARLRPGPPPRWAKPRRELLLLALCAVAALSTVNLFNVQDQSRFCLTDALSHGALTIDRCIGATKERSRYGGHLYANKAPGMSLLALPAALVVGYAPTPQIHQSVGARLWAVRLFACGLPFLLLVFLVGRVCESISAGTGAPALVTFALGTAVAPFAAVGFDHLPAAAFGFAAFVLAWRRRPLLAGLAAGAALLCEYEAAAIVGIVGVYAALFGVRALARYSLGLLPGAVLLLAYDWAAFGAPWRTPLAYSDNEYRAIHTSGIFGVHLPNLHSIRLVFIGSGGLLVISPVLLAAAVGLVLLWRRGLRAEAATCTLVTLAFVLAEAGYGDPYGGDSPLPRYLIPALPFLAVGLAPAFRRLRIPTTLLAAVSIVAMTTVTATWTMVMYHGYPDGIWSLLARVPSDGRYSWIAIHFAPNALNWLGASSLLAGTTACLAALTAFVLSLERDPSPSVAALPAL